MGAETAMTGGRSMGDPPSLREELRKLRVEQTRISWWRRLVHARLDLAVARTAGPRPLGDLRTGGVCLPGSDAPDAAELLAVLHGAAPAAEVGRLVELRDLDARLGAYEQTVASRLRAVGDDLVERLAADPDGALARPPVRVIGERSLGSRPASDPT
jgi:hypothetical protein